ncbi:MAG: N-acetylglucosamine-6-phosphate deacetylase [Treponema sp.]|nr:N-acetylglucosamine-6-phosphate deacetylase [Treponema sp.]
MSSPYVFCNCKLVLPDRVVPGNVLVENGIIKEVNEAESLAPPFPSEWNDYQPQIIDCDGQYISPGFIDIHNHGRLGCDAMDGKVTSMETIAKCHAEHGVTGFLAGTSSIPWKKSLESIRFLADYYKEENKRLASAAIENNKAKGAHYLGIYSEGSFFSMEKRGAHNPRYLKTELTGEDLNALAEAAGEALKVVALSPELPGAEEWIRFFSARGIVVTAAHSNATYDETLAGIGHGITLATHTFNGMRALSHQEPGILGAVLDDNRIYCEMIADGIHVAPVVLSLIYKLKGPDRIILISDSVIAGGLPDGRYEKGGDTVIVKDGVIRLEDGRLSGSSLSLDTAVRNMVKLAGASICHAVRAASLNPARILGIDKRKGSIVPEKDADLVIFDDNIQIKKVFVSGQPFLPQK